MDLTTTRDATGALTTKTPGAPAQGSNYGDLFAALIKQRMAQEAAAPVAASAPVNSVAERGASARIPEQYSAQPRDLSEVWGSSGTQGAPVKPKQISRTVPDPFASPYYTLQHGAGSVAPSREERLIDGRWEFEDIRPQGGSGGIQGGGALSSLHATLEPADPIRAQYGGGTPPAPNVATERTQAGTGPLTTDTGYTTQLQEQQKAAKAKQQKNTGYVESGEDFYRRTGLGR